MPSYVAWLDASAEAERRAREHLALRRAPENRDELGLGPVRDAFSDALFPGISASQTRARYFLLVPWLFGYGEEQLRLEGPALLRWVQRWEHEHLADAGSPSIGYWPGLVRFGILSRDLGADQLRRARPVRRDDDAEPSARPQANWVATRPAPPADFPAADPGPTLVRAEAEWLRERILEAAPGTLLAHLMRMVDRVEPASAAAWSDAAGQRATGAARGWLDDARRYAVTLHGAALMANLLVAERYERAGLTRIEPPVEPARARLLDWAGEVSAMAPELAGWDTNPLWTRLREVDPRISGRTSSFVDAWRQAVLTGAGPDQRALRELVAARVRRTESRLTNDRLLRTWSGASGAARLSFRWSQVQVLARELADALA